MKKEILVYQLYSRKEILATKRCKRERERERERERVLIINYSNFRDIMKIHGGLKLGLKGSLTFLVVLVGVVMGG